MKLLIVDDSNIIRSWIQRSTAAKGFTEVRTAANGRLALSEFRDFHPDFVTMDITMPEMDGLTCIDAMLTEQPDVRILVISALKDKSTAVEAIKRGAQGFLLKPFKVEALDEAIEEILED